MINTALLLPDLQNEITDSAGKVSGGGSAKIVAKRGVLGHVRAALDTAPGARFACRPRPAWLLRRPRRLPERGSSRGRTEGGWRDGAGQLEVRLPGRGGVAGRRVGVHQAMREPVFQHFAAGLAIAPRRDGAGDRRCGHAGSASGDTNRIRATTTGSVQQRHNEPPLL